MECSTTYVRELSSIFMGEFIGGFQVRVALEMLDVVETTFRSCTLSGAAGCIAVYSETCVYIPRTRPVGCYILIIE